MNTGLRIGLAVGFGYFLGRRKKLRSALVLATAVAAGRASRGPGGLLEQGRQLLQSPRLSGLGRLGSPLVSAGRDAATAAAGSGIDALSGRLRGSADALRRRSPAADGDTGQREEPGRDQPQGTDQSRNESRRRPAGSEPERANAGSRRGR
ncbi:hypothetical protein [Plantactinospora sp. WMMB782]|uniref:hypothetical protein n=1 Tax=Plantactinospora sp. WMMB782 TaxID=3404121 RepID=UPI003B924CAB